MDLYTEITYDINLGIPLIRTNLKEDKIDEFLTEYIRFQIGKGEDKSEAKKRDVYNIKIECDLSFDIFSIKSDTGNKGLTTGIIMDSIGKWKLQNSEKGLAGKLKNE